MDSSIIKKNEQNQPQLLLQETPSEKPNKIVKIFDHKTTIFFHHIQLQSNFILFITNHVLCNSRVLFLLGACPLKSRENVCIVTLPMAKAKRHTNVNRLRSSQFKVHFQLFLHFLTLVLGPKLGVSM